MNEIKKILESRRVEGIGDLDKHRCSLCIALVEEEGAQQVVLEVRSSKIDSQPGDVCLPGGTMEKGESPLEAAIRETSEELLISPSQVEILGQGDIFRTDQLVIYPYIALLHDYRWTYNADEVASIFTVPLDFFVESKPEEYLTSYIPQFAEDFPFERIVGGKDYKWRKVQQRTYFYQYEEHTIWGITALVMYSLGRILRGEV